MNYLAHAFLSFQNEEILVGNLIGDFVKGKKALELFPENIKNGIILHREIDRFSDEHIANLKAKNIFRPVYRLYSGAIIDTIYDHFLANDPRFFADSKSLDRFAQQTYLVAHKYEKYLPERFNTMLTYMEKENWLYHYRTLKGMKQALGGLQRRAQYITEVDTAYELLVTHYYELNQLYFEFIDDMVVYVKRQLRMS